MQVFFWYKKEYLPLSLCIFKVFLTCNVVTVESVFQFLEDSDTSLLLSLNHPQPAVRVLAFQHLKDVIETSKVCV